MLFTTDEIQQRLQLGEDSAWEFKQIEFQGNRPIAPRRNDLADEIGAFANAAAASCCAALPMPAPCRG